MRRGITRVRRDQPKRQNSRKTVSDEPGGIHTSAYLMIDRIWDSLHDHPRFQALLEEYADDVEH
jgi:hypothetical protein